MLVVIDNITLAKDCRPPNALVWDKGRPFEHRSITFSPKYVNGEICRYDGRFKNLKLFWYPGQIFICNSIHKYWHGNNFTDFHLCDMQAAIEKLCDDTGIRWKGATIKKVEYGCNIEANATIAYRSLKSYRGKDYTAMNDSGGKVYGAACDFADYRIKGYDKTHQVKRVQGVTLNKSLFRWEVALDRMRGMEGKLNASPLTLEHLLVPYTWQALATDAIMKYQKTIKMQQFHLHKIESVHDKRVLAAMLIPEIRDEIKRHHKDTFKLDRRIYNRIMADKSICIVDDLADQMRAKFDHLINGNSI